MKDTALWDRLQAHDFDGPSGSRSFAERLAATEGWSEDMAERVTEEYRRFLYLAAIAETHVTPSEKVDRAWHLHLTDTRDYWETLCARVLGRPLHHEPGRTEDDAVRHEAQYVATRALYADEFGRAPPADIWARGKTRAKKSQGRKFLLSATLAGAVGAILSGTYWLLIPIGAVFAGALFSGSGGSGRVSVAAGDCGADCGGGGCGD